MSDQIPSRPQSPAYYEGAVSGLEHEAQELAQALGPLGFDPRHDSPLRLQQWRQLLEDYKTVLRALAHYAGPPGVDLRDAGDLAAARVAAEIYGVRIDREHVTLRARLDKEEK